MWRSKAFNRIRAGRIAKHRGADFETMFMWACKRESLVCIRIADGCRTISRNKLVRQKQPFDFIVGYLLQGLVAFIDTKTIDQKTFPKSMIDSQQCDSLLSLSYCKQVSGYVIYFRPLNQIVFFNAFKLNDLNPGNSLKPEDGIILGTSEQWKLSLVFQNQS